jgi:hypothetical protein
MRGELNRFAHYLKKVFKFHRLVRRFRDRRQEPRIPTHSVVLSLFFGAVMRVPSFFQLEKETKRSHWQRHVGWKAPISDDTFDYVAERLDLETLRQGLLTTNKILKRNKAFEASKYSGLLVAAIDGNEQFKSRSRCCPRCRQRQVRIKSAQGEEERVTEYYHHQVYCQIIGPHFSVILDLEEVRPGEDEVGAALRLLGRIRRLYGPRFFDVVLADAGFSEGPFWTAVRKMGWGVITVLKQERYEVWQEAQQLSQGRSGETFSPSTNEHVELWEVKDLRFTDTYQKETVRVVRSRETGSEVRQRGGVRKPEPYDHQWCWLASSDLDGLPKKMVWSIGHGRWKIENNAFCELTQHWNLEHCAHHDPVAIEALLLIRVLAFNLFRAFAQLCGKAWRAGRVTLQEVRRQLDLAMTTDNEVLLWSG